MRLIKHTRALPSMVTPRLLIRNLHLTSLCSLALELDSTALTDTPALGSPCSKHWPDHREAHQLHSHSDVHLGSEADPRAGWCTGRSKFLQTLYLLSVTCLRRGMRLVSLCTAGWLLKSGFLVVDFIRHRMTVTTMQAIMKTPMQ